VVPEIEAWVREFLEKGQEGEDHAWVDIAQVAVRPGGGQAACTVTIRPAPGQPTSQHVAVVDLSTGEHHFLDQAAPSSRPTWSPEGARLAVVVSVEGRGDQALVLDPDDSRDAIGSAVDGSVENLHWSPDGTELALVVAQPGAELSDLYGSGVVGTPGGESWRPRVLPREAGRRLLVLWRPTDGRSHQPTPLNVWEANWLGPSALVVLASHGSGEDDWYTATLLNVDAQTGTATTLVDPPHQLAMPRTSPSGRSWAVLSGAASDRDLLAGEILVATGAGDPTPLDTAGVHVTDHQWLDEDRLLFTGLRGFETVVAVADIGTAGIDVLWAGPETSGRHQPELAQGCGSEPLVVLESHTTPPTLGVIRAGHFEPVLTTSGVGTSYATERSGHREGIVWTSPDGTEIHGYLTVPEGNGPHALVVEVHGGPVTAMRNTWSGRDPYVSLLVARGYAVLQPNPRGSTGRGAAYAQAVIGDMGGADVYDILSGIEHLVAEGAVDPARIGVAGVSYGGFMAAWMPTLTDIFAASVSRSPCTDWVLMYLTSNIREFVRIFVDGEPDDRESQYWSRSPLQHHSKISTPMLLTSGALDLACPSSQAHSLHTALAEQDVASELVVYPEEGNDVMHHAALVDQCARMIGWFERFMPPAPGSPQH
jgi:dipeptidyl aminopeptidase/acylaminoacyl peptidase